MCFNKIYDISSKYYLCGPNLENTDICIEIICTCIILLGFLKS